MEKQYGTKLRFYQETASYSDHYGQDVVAIDSTCVIINKYEQFEVIDCEEK